MALGLRQAELARTVAVSPSYLNLIEHNRRPAGAGLLARIAAALGIAADALGEDAGAALVAGLRDAQAGQQAAPPVRGAAAATPLAETDRIEEFAGRFPGWAGLILRQQERIAQLDRAVETLSDRMAHDPHLSASLHEVLSTAAALRSTATILADTEDLDPQWRARFHRNLSLDSERLSRGAEALVAYLDASVAEDTGIASPQEEVEAWLSGRGFHIAPLEAEGGGDIEAVLAAAAELVTTASRQLARGYLERYRADAVTVPAEALRRAMEQQGALAAPAGQAGAVGEIGASLDPGALAQALGTDPARVMRRIACLSGALGGGPVGLVACDGSGTVTFRHPLEGFALPRYGGACPLWPLYQALVRPMQPVRARLAMAGRLPRHFLAYAICQPVQATRFGAPEVLEATMLILPEPAAPAHPRAPADGPGAVLAVGSACRICPRGGCTARREPAIVGENA